MKRNQVSGILRLAFAISIIAAVTAVLSPTPSLAQSSLNQNMGAVLRQLLSPGNPLPTLWNYSTPQTYGANRGGVTDSTAAFQAAINAGDVLVPAGTYLINGNVWVPNNRNIQCQNGAVLLTTLKTPTEGGILDYYNTGWGSVVGCTFRGTNTTIPAVEDDTQARMLIDMSSAQHVQLIGDTFEYAWGDSAVHMTYAASALSGSSSNTVEFCTFRNNALYGLAIVSGANNLIAYDQFLDSSVGSESNQPTGYQNAGNVFTQLNITQINGNGYEYIFLSGGAYPVGSDYSGNTVVSNYVSGAKIVVTDGNSVTPASYINNTCVNGCWVH
ncbi:MAG: hypothetical protein JO071_08665 [Deltaproteobacteria bacterium]|nr:hypothetical protein [Deltaproteobacteria bacterium]